MKKSFFIAGRASGKTPYFYPDDTKKYKLPRKQKKAFIKKFGRVAYQQKWFWSPVGPPTYYFLKNFTEFLQGVNNAKKVDFHKVHFRDYMDNLRKEQWEAMEVKERYFFGDWDIAPLPQPERDIGIAFPTLDFVMGNEVWCGYSGV